MRLTRDHLRKIVRLDVLTVVEVPDMVFKEGDIIVLFNNTEEFTTLQSLIKNSYRSSFSKPKTMFEIPPKGLVNLVFVSDDTLVVTVGL